MEIAPLTAFYDIDTPVTLAKLARGDFESLSPELVACYDLYLALQWADFNETGSDGFTARCVVRSIRRCIFPPNASAEPI